MTYFGETLRKAREAKGLTTSQVAEKTRILVQMHLDGQRRKQADRPDHSPSRYLDENQKGK